MLNFTEKEKTVPGGFGIILQFDYMYINLKTELLPTGKNAESTFFQVRTGFGNNNGPHAAWNQQSQEGQEPPALKEYPDSCRIFPEASPSPPKGRSPGVVIWEIPDVISLRCSGHARQVGKDLQLQGTSIGLCFPVFGRCQGVAGRPQLAWNW